MKNLHFLDSVKKMPALMLPVRTVVATLGKAVVMISPGSQLTVEQLKSVPTVTDIVAPSLMHTAGMKAAAAVHPQARLWGPAGVREKHPRLTWSVLGVDAWPYEAELTPISLEGAPRYREWLFLHRESRTLIAGDLVFNLLDAKGLGARLLLSLVFDAWRRLAMPKLMMRFVDDRVAFERSLKKVTALEFEHLVPSHGEVVMHEGRSRLSAALAERRFRV